MTAPDAFHVYESDFDIPELQINENIPELGIYNEHYVWEIDSDYVETEECIYSDDNDEEIDEHFDDYSGQFQNANLAQAEYDVG